MANRNTSLSGRGVFAMAVAAGAAIWLLSPWLTGHREPWDSPGPYYTVTLTLAGLGLGLLAPRHFWCASLGLLSGQLLVFGAYALVPPQEFWLLGVIALVVYSGLGFAGAAAGALGTWLVRQGPGGGRRGSLLG
jgi:hypothetical protein